jgi:hypothetical protein
VVFECWRESCDCALLAILELACDRHQVRGADNDYATTVLDTPDDDDVDQDDINDADSPPNARRECTHVPRSNVFLTPPSDV